MLIICKFTTKGGDYTGAYYRDYFRDSGLKLAGMAKTKDAADRILRDTYRGPDIDGVGVVWEIESE